MIHKFISRINTGHWPGLSLIDSVNRKKWKVCATVLFGLLVFNSAHAQTPIPTPSPTPTPITKTDQILINNPSTVGRLTKWVSSGKNGIGTIGDSVIKESSIGTIGIGINPLSDFKLGVNGDNAVGGLYGGSVNGTGVVGSSSTGSGVVGLTSGQGAGVFGRGDSSTGVMGVSNWGYAVHGFSPSGFAGFFAGRVNVTESLSAGGLSLYRGGVEFADGTSQSTAATITGVTAGVGLIGGGGFGNVTLGIANAGVNTGQLADGAVTGAKIAAGQTVKSLNGLSDSVTLAAGDNVTITPSGNTLTISATAGSGGTSSPARALNPQQIATLRWYEVNEVGGDFDGGLHPLGMAFDGTNIWVTNYGGNTIRKMSVSNGQLLGTYTVGNNPVLPAFDGTNIWVTNEGSNTVTKLRASDGAVVGTYSVGPAPNRIAFDGINIWVTISGNNTVVKLRSTDGVQLGAYTVGAHPAGVAFDGTNIWVTNYNGNTVNKLRGSDGALLGTFSVGTSPHSLAFDGASIWVTNAGSNTVTKLRSSDGATLGTFTVGVTPTGIAFDGSAVWVANHGIDQFNHNVMKLRASDGTLLSTFTPGANSWGFAFDGVNMWISNYGSNSVSKR